MNLNKDQVISALTLVGFEVICTWELMNQYWPRTDEGHYNKIIIQNPNTLVQTQFGLIEFKNRKRVVQIEWSSTELKLDLEKDNSNITSDLTYVHCWTIEEVIKQLHRLKVAFEIKEE